MKKLSLLLNLVLFFFLSAVNAAQLDIIYFANINAQLENCHCGDPSLGGLDRIIHIIKEKRKNNSSLIVADGGDFFNSYSYPNLNKAVMELYGLLQPDVCLFADQEFVEDDEFFLKYKPFYKKFGLWSNINLKGESGLKDFYSNAEAKNIVFLTYLDKSAFDIITPPANLQFDKKKFDALYDKFKENNIIIILFHGSSEKLNDFKKKYFQCDLILNGHTQLQDKNLSQKPYIISGGSDGTLLKHISVTFEKDKIIKIDLNNIPVSLDVPVDSSAIKILDKWQIH